MRWHLHSHTFPVAEITQSFRCIPVKNSALRKKVTGCDMTAKAVGMAVYTQLTNEQISAMLEVYYDIGTLAFAVGITQGVENTNYLIATHDAQGVEQKYILTLYEKRMDPKELPFFIALMHHLAARGVACPSPIMRRDGALFGLVEGKPAAIVSFVNGKSRTQLANAHVASVGAALAGLHTATMDFEQRRENRLSLVGWQGLYTKLEGQLDGIYAGLETLVKDELAYLSAHWPAAGLPQAVIHADLFSDNVFFDGDAVSG
jgi:homoserine kinase type II